MAPAPLLFVQSTRPCPVQLAVPTSSFVHALHRPSTAFTDHQQRPRFLQQHLSPRGRARRGCVPPSLVHRPGPGPSLHYPFLAPPLQPSRLRAEDPAVSDVHGFAGSILQPYLGIVDEDRPRRRLRQTTRPRGCRIMSSYPL